MTTEEFVALFSKERLVLLRAYTADPALQSQVAIDIAALGLTAAQKAKMTEIVDGILTDAFYTVLLGLDGAASIGDVQQSYSVSTQKGDVVVDGRGDVEGLAWEYFHGPKRQNA